jgi:hypothetical protein
VNGVWSPLRGRIGAAALGTFVVVGAISGMTGALPTASAAPATDDSGFIDSTARCAPPSKAVAFGYTASSRVAICKDDASGQYQYRGVRVSDGARLILGAKSTDRGYVAENDGITYTVTSSALVVTSGGQQVRDEPMIDFHGTAGSATPTTSAMSSATPTTSVQSSAAPETVTPTTPLPPPLPAEIGG